MVSEPSASTMTDGFMSPAVDQPRFTAPCRVQATPSGEVARWMEYAPLASTTRKKRLNAPEGCWTREGCRSFSLPLTASRGVVQVAPPSLEVDTYRSPELVRG